jgi:hypothetical protein
MTPTTAALPPANPGWGFWGAIRRHADQAEAWALTCQAIGAASGCSETAVRDFLDSRSGRHFADDVGHGLFEGMNLAEAVDAAVARWMAWTITRRTESATGIPRGLPYLTGFVTDCEIMAEAG